MTLPSSFTAKLALLLLLGLQPNYADTTVSKDPADTSISGPTGVMDKSFLGAGVKSIDALLNRAGLKAAIKKAGLSGNSADQVERVARLAIKNIAGTDQPNREALLRGLSVVNRGVDVRVKNNLVAILTKPEAQMTNDDFVNAVNALVYIAGRYGLDNSLALACSACVGDTLASKGFLFSYEQVTDKTTNFILKNVIPNNAAHLSRFIKGRMNRLGYKNVSARALGLLNPADEKNFALFLSIPEHGSAAQKELFKAIEAYSTKPNGNVDYFDVGNFHKFWRLYTNDLSDKEVAGWSRILNEVVQDASKRGETNKKNAFYRYFENKVAEDPSLAPHLETLKRKNCYFK